MAVAAVAEGAEGVPRIRALVQALVQELWPEEEEAVVVAGEVEEGPRTRAPPHTQVQVQEPWEAEAEEAAAGEAR